MVMYMKILLTGFKPFGKNISNPSLGVLDELKNRRTETIEVLKLDVVYGLDGEKVVEKIKEIKPDVVLSIGLAGGRSKVCLEAIALNARDSEFKDNQGQIFLNEKISNGPLAYDSTLNLKRIKEKIENENFMISYSAGTYVCNDVYYQELEYIVQNNLNIACGFVHIPYTEPKEEEPYLELNEIVHIISELLDVILEERKCLK